MTARYETRRGERVLILDIPYRRSDGTSARYRRDSTAATLTAAREEDRRIRDRIAKTGSPFEEQAVEPPEQKKFSELVGVYRSTYLPSLKRSTRRGYESVLDIHLVPHFGDLPVIEVSAQAASTLDLKLAKTPGVKAGTTKAKNTRNNIQIVLRSVLRFGSKHGYLSEVPGALPQLKRGGDLIPDIPNDHQVARILELSSPSQRRAFLLMAYAGLRPNEVRALENRNVRLNSNKAEPDSGFIWVREGESYGERHSPKTGQRQIPIGGPLLAELAQAKGSPETCVALTAQGRPWAQWGLYQAFLRTCTRAKIEGFTVYSLRHYAITLWLRAGVPVHVVQRMAGHKHLATTARYVHLLRGDLDEAAMRIGNMLATASPTPPTDPTTHAA
jgi:integrase